MRAQKSGVVAGLGSISGWSGVPAAGLYCATKAAVAIYTEGLRDEFAEFGIQTTCIGPGFFRTSVLVDDDGNKVRIKGRIKELESVTKRTGEMLKNYNQYQPGYPVKGAQVIVETLTGTGRCKGQSASSVGAGEGCGAGYKSSY